MSWQLIPPSIGLHTIVSKQNMNTRALHDGATTDAKIQIYESKARARMIYLSPCTSLLFRPFRPHQTTHAPPILVPHHCHPRQTNHTLPIRDTSSLEEEMVASESPSPVLPTPGLAFLGLALVFLTGGFLGPPLSSSLSQSTRSSASSESISV